MRNLIFTFLLIFLPLFLFSQSCDDNVQSIYAVGMYQIKVSENLNLIEKPCPSGYPTIGWGHKVTKNEKHPDTITVAYADSLLKSDFIKYFNHASKTYPNLKTRCRIYAVSLRP